jgi:predicted AAA+ superfamily ATPase
VREFSKRYSSFIEVNLERNADRQVFDRDNVREILEILRLRENISPKPDTLLLFIDEIQELPRTIELLRFFYEDLPDLHVICAGSLLEHAIRHIRSFPVGRIQQIVIHPFDFEEFLLAKDQKQLLEELDEIPVRELAHDILLEHFHEYVTLGGMPEAIKVYLETGSFSAIHPVYQEIWETYKDDIEKYGRNDTEKKVLRHVIDTAPQEKDRVSFTGFGGSNYRNREVGEALRALDKARLISLVYPTTSVTLPQEVDFTRKPRLQFLDTGLLNYAMGIQSEMIGLKTLSDFYRGRIIQHAVWQQVIALSGEVGKQYHFWVREKTSSSAEVDLVYPYNGYLIPVEVKSGPKGRLRSLHQFIDRSPHTFGVRLLSNKNLLEKVRTPAGKDFTLLNLPYYLASRLPGYIDWMISRH